MKVYENQIIFRLSKQVEELVDNVGEDTVLVLCDIDIGNRLIISISTSY